jgi:hypothetical protein
MMTELSVLYMYLYYYTVVVQNTPHLVVVQHPETKTVETIKTKEE